MNHADIGKHLADYLEGELPIEERALLDAHLDGCNVCAGEVEEMLRTIRLLRTLPEPETPPMIAANVTRRIRSGESQLGFFQRIARPLGVVFEPGFVLPASAIAVAALVVTVVQGLDVLPTSNLVGEGGHASIGQSASSAALLPSTMPSVLAPRHVYGESDALDIVARVERRATQSDPRLHRADKGQRMAVAIGGVTREFGPRIRINLNGLVLAQQPMAQPPLTSGGPILSPRIPGAWAAGDGSGMWGVQSRDASPGMLVVAERFGSSNFMADPGGWPRASSPGGTDPRDAWLALGFEDPAEFARYIAAQNLAEQELWAARLSERAEGRGLLDEFLETLRESGDPTAVWVADDFAAQVDRMSSGSSDLKAQVAP